MLNENGLLNKLATMAIVGLLSWNVYTTQKLSLDVAVMKTNLSNLLEDRYTRIEGESAVARLEDRLLRVEERLNNVERNKTSRQ